MRGRLFFLLLAAVVLCAMAPVEVLAQDTDLRVTRSGSDLLFSWTGGTANYNVTASNGSPQFQYPQTLAVGLPGPPGNYTYSNGFANGLALQFFDVSGTTESSPAGNYTGGATPPPVPQVTSVSPTSGLKVGDTLTINGSGFSTIPNEDVVHFPEGITATANASPQPTATSFQITIPRGALSGPAWVQVGNQVSGSMSLVILTQAGFQNLSGVAYQPTTHDIWLADRGWGSSYYTRILQLHFSGTTWGKTEYDNSGSGTWKYQGGQGFDSGQRWYYGVAASAVGGGTRTVTTGAASPAATSFMQVKPGSSDYLYVIGAATSPALTNTAFFAYNDSTTGEKHIRELHCDNPPCTGGGGTVVDNDYGNFGATNLNFNALAGLALDQNGNLFDTETTQVRKITPSETSSVVITGFSGAIGIAVDQVNTSDPGELLVSDSSANTLYGVDLSLPQKQTVISGLSGHRAASFAVTPLNTVTCNSGNNGLPNTDLAFVLADETTQVRQVPDPRITLLPSAPTRVWISKGRADDQYPSPYQSADHQITITATTTPGRTVYFRVIDPPDTAPYADGTNTGFWCDNKDPGTSNNAGKLSTSPSGPWTNVVSVQANASTGKASVILNTTDHYAGDNYIVQASFDDWTTNATKALAETGIITAWKRVYIEKDKMFRKGAVLVENCAACSALRVANSQNLQDGDSIIVFDETNTAESGGETRTVSGAPTDNGDGSWTVNLNAALSKTYYASGPGAQGSPPTYGPPDFANGHSGGVGVPSAGFYEADLGSMWQTYNDAFVEFWVPPDGAGAVPYLPPSLFGDDAASNTRLCYFSQIWFKNFLNGGGGPPALDQPHNYFHLVGASQSAAYTGYSWSPYDWSFIMVGQLEALGKTAPQTTSMIQDTTMHELGHQYAVNKCSSGGHDSRNAWCATSAANNCALGGATPELCVMNAVPEGSTDSMDGVSRFCVEDLLLGDPNCPAPTPPNPRDGAIRTDADPQ